MPPFSGPRRYPSTPPLRESYVDADQPPLELQRRLVESVNAERDAITSLAERAQAAFDVLERERAALECERLLYLIGPIVDPPRLVHTVSSDNTAGFAPGGVVPRPAPEESVSYILTDPNHPEEAVSYILTDPNRLSPPRLVQAGPGVVTSTCSLPRGCSGYCETCTMCLLHCTCEKKPEPQGRKIRL